MYQAIIHYLNQINTVFSLLGHEGIVGLIPAGRPPLPVHDACDIRSGHAK
jgi:hypothetical protein